MSEFGKWVNPIAYCFTLSCMEGADDPNPLPEMFVTFFEELQPYIMHEMGSRRRFQGCVSGGGIRPSMHHDGDFPWLINSLRDTEKRTEAERRFTLAEWSLCADCIPQDAVALKKIDPEWKDLAARFLMSHDVRVDPEERKTRIAEIMSSGADRLERLAFPRKCLPSHFSGFLLSYRTASAKLYDGDEEYDAMFRDSGTSEAVNGAAQSDIVMRQLLVSIPQSFFDRKNVSFPFQEIWAERLKKMCSGSRISVGSLKADIPDGSMRGHPHTTFNDTFLLGFRKWIAEIGWGMCLTQEQALLLGGNDCLLQSGVFEKVETCPDGHVYIQLTPNIAFVPKEKLKQQWLTFEPHARPLKHQGHTTLEAPVSFCLGIGVHNIAEISDMNNEWYSITTNHVL